MSRPLLSAVYDPHAQHALLSAIIRQRSHRIISESMADDIASDLMKIHIDSPERDHERNLAEIAVAGANRRANLAEVGRASDMHKRKMYFLERGIVGIAIQTVLGNIHERRGVFNFMVVMTILLLLALLVQA